MPQGSCFCGNVRYSFESEASAHVVCHCLTCRKITGSAFTTNMVVPAEGFKTLSGTVKSASSGADSGRSLSKYFCADCGTTLWLMGDAFGDNKIVQVGTLDDAGALEAAKPGVEQYTPRRAGWIAEVKGASQHMGMA